VREVWAQKRELKDIVVNKKKKKASAKKTCRKGRGKVVQA